MATPSAARGATTRGQSFRSATTGRYTKGRSASTRSTTVKGRSAPIDSSRHASGTDRLVTVTPVEKKAAELRVKIDRQRGMTTPDHIKAIAEARPA